MLMQTLLGIAPDEFWHVQPYEKKLLQKKQGRSKAIWFFLYRWFGIQAGFPVEMKDLPEDFFNTHNAIALIKRHQESKSKYYPPDEVVPIDNLISQHSQKHIIERDEQEISMLCLHLLQTCVIYVNTLLVEDFFKDNDGFAHVTEEDARALTALFYLHINPYGTFEIDFTKRLALREIRTGVAA